MHERLLRLIISQDISLKNSIDVHLNRLKIFLLHFYVMMSVCEKQSLLEVRLIHVEQMSL